MLATVIYNTNGQHFRCEFEKKDGTLRTLYGCIKPKENSQGLKYCPKDKGLICVYDLDAAGYRMINIEGLKWVEVLDEPYDAIEDRVVIEDEDYADR